MIEKVVCFQDAGVPARIRGRKINPLITHLLCPQGQNILEMCARGRETPGHDGERIPAMMDQDRYLTGKIRAWAGWDKAPGWDKAS